MTPPNLNNAKETGLEHQGNVCIKANGRVKQFQWGVFNKHDSYQTNEKGLSTKPPTPKKMYIHMC